MAKNKDKAKAMYTAACDLSELGKEQLRSMDTIALEEVLSAVGNLMVAPVPEGKEDVVVEVRLNVLKLLSLLSSAPIARVLYQRYK